MHSGGQESKLEVLYSVECSPLNASISLQQPSGVRYLSTQIRCTPRVVCNTEPHASGPPPPVFGCPHGAVVQFELHAVGGQYPWLQAKLHSPS